MILDPASFKRILTAFADDSADIILERGRILLQIRDETLDAKLVEQNGDLLVEENGERLKARSWIAKRLARLPMLAERICSLPPPPNFVMPSGNVESVDSTSRSGEPADDIGAATMKELGERTPFMTSVWYLTADAGEGKTSLIDHLAIRQARAYKQKETDWLLVPIPLGGRTFLRFDDVVIATLVNRLRFQILYYDAFLELVRLGVLVPAFDGFEEMIIESSSGEAISALGGLVSDLQSCGSVLIAARKAYFDYASFRSQARLFDSIGKSDVTFGRLALKRWDRDHFVAYAQKRRLSDPGQLFEQVEKNLRTDHPLLTRAVLVRRLVDVALETEGGLSDLLKRIGRRPLDYFHEFVNELIEREANAKWMDKSGEPPRPLLTVAEHHDLLSMVAHEMWISSTNELKMDEIDFIAEMFTEDTDKNPSVARQIQERLKQHALLVGARNGRALAFDHEDFRLFYLGEALGQALVVLDEGRIKALLDVASIPRDAVEHAASRVVRSGGRREPVVDLLRKISVPETPISFIRENCGALTIALLHGESAYACEASHMSFPEDALKGRSLKGLTVEDSHFSPTSLAGTKLTNCKFFRCRFERLELSDQSPVAARRITFEACEIGSLVQIGEEEPVETYAPEQIRDTLCRRGFEFRGHDEVRAKKSVEAGETSEDMRLVERALRAFRRTTGVNESTMKLRLGAQARQFMKNILPRLLDARILEREQYTGKGNQQRFRLAVSMQLIDDAMRSSRGRIDRFVDAFEKSLRS